jgi:hypothetical protein
MGFFSEYKQVKKLLQQKQQVVFYAESRHYYRYFERLIIDLLASGTEIYYITSDAGDPLLKNIPAKMKVVYVKWMLGFLFSKIRTDVMIMTMPDLGNFLFKRSAGTGTYVYIFHAAVSTHQQYRRDAFFNYDAIFCTGNYQYNEIRKAEEVNGLKSKSLIGYGYPLFDELKREARVSKKDNTDMSTILVAPSWFEGCIFDTCIEELLRQLSNLPYNVVLRSHPEYEKRNRKNFLKIKKMLAKHPAMRIDNEHDVIKSLPKADILITDRSGIAFEFAFGVGRPVLFIDTPLKEINPRWKELPCIDPIENRLRDQLGVSVSPEKLNEIPEKIKELKILQNGFAGKMEQLGKDIFFNADESYQKAVDYILKKLNRN